MSEQQEQDVKSVWMLYILIFKETDLSEEQEVMSLSEQYDYIVIKLKTRCICVSVCSFYNLKEHFNIYLESF